MRAYLRLDPNLPDRKGGYPDGAYRAYIDTLCFAEQQPQRGRFRSRRLLSVLLEKRAKWIPYLISHGDLTETDRMRRLRARRRDVTPTDTPDVTLPTVYTPSSGKRLAVGGKQEAEAGGRNNGAPTTFMGFRPKEPGIWGRAGTHDGRHGNDCSVCHPGVPTHAR
jgi:hypothetical protein